MDAVQDHSGLGSVSLDCGSGITLNSAGRNFYLVVPAGSLSAGFSLEVASSDGKAIVKNGKPGSVTIKRSTARSMPSFPYSGRFKSAFLRAWYLK